MPFRELDPLLHSELRLAVMSLLLSVKEAEFTYLKEKTGATAGNLSVQITKLGEAGDEHQPAPQQKHESVFGKFGFRSLDHFADEQQAFVFGDGFVLHGVNDLVMQT